MILSDNSQKNKYNEKEYTENNQNYEENKSYD